MSSNSNPYEATQSAASGQLSFRQRSLAGIVGLLVAVGASVTMLAFVFGITIAFAGDRMAPPVSFSAILASSMGPWFIAGSAGTLPIALLLGLFSMSRVLRVQRSMNEASARRHVLTHQLDELRKSRLSK